MKKILTLMLIMLFSFSLVACQNKDDVTNVSESKFGLVMSVTNYDAHKIYIDIKSQDKDNIYLDNDNNEELGTGTEYFLKKFNEETKTYEDVPYILDNIAWEEPLYIVSKDHPVLSLELRYDYLYGDLTPGLYEVTKPVLYVKEPGNLERDNLYANFEVTKEDYEKEQNKTSEEKLNDTLESMNEDEVIHLPMQPITINENVDSDKSKKNYEQTQIVFEDAILTWNDDKSEFYISLKGNPTTGYTWAVNNNGTFATCDNNYEYVSDVKQSSDQAKMIVGAGGRFNYTIKIDKSKRTSSNATVVSFKYYRSWEGDSSIIKDIHVLFDIDNNGEINAALTRPVV